MEFPNTFDPEACILFLGAGFSTLSTNIGGTQPPAGSGLADTLKKATLLPETDTSELADIAAYAGEKGVDIAELLRTIFTVSDLSEEQKKILTLPWRRIYTTNYDDTVEYFSSISGEPKRLSFSHKSAYPRQIPDGAIIHLHGYIHQIDESNVLSELVLSRQSYVEQFALSSPWFDLLSKDVRLAEHIFFLGYELSDFAPANYLSQVPEAVRKTHFILRAAKSPTAETKLRPYGTRHDFGVSGFSGRCTTATKQERPRHARELTSFRYVDVNLDKRAAKRPTANEIFELFALGRYSTHRLLDAFGTSDYVAQRLDDLEHALTLLRENKSIVIHSKVGNGKSIFTELFLIHLTTKGHTCFVARPHLSPLASDLEFIRQQSKPVVVFPTFDSALSLAHLFAGFPKEARFVCEAPTSTFRVRYSEIASQLPSPLTSLDANKLSVADLKDVESILHGAGLLPLGFSRRFRPGCDIRDIVLSVFDNEKVRQRIDKLVHDLFENSRAKSVVISTAIFKALGIHSDPSFLRSVLGFDPFGPLAEKGEAAYEVMDFTLDKLSPHSAIFSEYLISNYLEGEALVGAVYWLASEAAARIEQNRRGFDERTREARVILGQVLRYGFLDAMLRRRSDRAELIERLYEKCRRDKNIAEEPLFWLQFSIHKQNEPDLPLAEKYMRAAYDRAKSRPGFLTYQLDTNYLELILKIEGQFRENSSRFDDIMSLVEKNANMIGDGNHRAHAVKALTGIETWHMAVSGTLSESQSATVTSSDKKIVSEIENLRDFERDSETSELKLTLLRLLSRAERA